MPALVTPPQTEPRRDIGENDGGSGRLPPPDKRTGGGGNGDGENWSQRPVGSRGPRERLMQWRIGIACALGADLLFFIAIISAFLVNRSSYHFDAYSNYINTWLPTAIPSILWLNTAVILISSVTAEIAREGMFREIDAMDEWFGLGKPLSKRASLWLGATLVLGMLFLAGQWIAWQQLAAAHSHATGNQSQHFFYILTISHAAHLFLGIAGLIAALSALRTSRQFATRQLIVDSTVWYWHAMGALWIILFVLLEFCQ